MSERWRHLIFETSPLPSYGPLQLQRMLRLRSSRLARGAAVQHAIVSARCRGHAVRAHGRAARSAACKSQTGLPASSSAGSGRCMSPRCVRSRIGRSRRRCYCSATAPRPRRAYTSSVRRGCPGWMVCGCEPPDGSRSRWSVCGSCLHAATVQAPSSAKAQLRLGTWCYRQGVAVLQGAGGGGGGGGGAGGGGGGGATGAVVSTSSGSGGGIVLKLAERAQLRHLIESAFPQRLASAPHTYALIAALHVSHGRLAFDDNAAHETDAIKGAAAERPRWLFEEMFGMMGAPLSRVSGFCQ
jgi:hypothetical protein